MVDNVEETVTFYKDHLGFQLRMSVPRHGNLQWALMGNGDVEIMFQSRESFEKEYPDQAGVDIGASQTLYISVNGIEELHALVSDKTEILKDLHTTFYGMTEFTMVDCNGYLLVFSERL